MKHLDVPPERGRKVKTICLILLHFISIMKLNPTSWMVYYGIVKMIV